MEVEEVEEEKVGKMIGIKDGPVPVVVSDTLCPAVYSCAAQMICCTVI